MARTPTKRLLKNALYCVGLFLTFAVSSIVGKAHATSLILPGLEKGINAESPRHAESLQFLRKNSFDKVIDLETKNLRANPNDRSSQVLLALAYIGKGNDKAAEGQAELLSKSDPAYAAKLYQNMGVYYTYKKRFYRGLRSLNLSLSLVEDPEVLNQIAAIFLLQGRLPKAKDYLVRSLPTKPDHIDLSRISLAERDYEAAIDFAQKAITTNPKSSEAYLLLGTARLLSGQLAKAESDFKKAKELSPDPVIADYNIGLIHLAQDKYDDALKDFDRMAARAPKVKEAQLGRAVAWHAVGNLEKAQAAAEKAVQAEPGDFLGQLVLGNIYSSKNFSKEADQAYRKAGSLFVEFTLPRFQSKEQLGFSSVKANAGFSLANLFYRNGMFDQTLKTIQGTFGRQSESNYFLALTSARAERMSGNHARAENLLEAAIRLYPKPVSAYMELGDIAAGRSDFKRAAAYYEKASAAEPQLSQLHFILGDLYIKMNDTSKAVSSYQAGLKQDPKSGPGLNQLAWTLAEKEGRLADALPLAQKADSYSPGNPRIKDTLAWIHHGMGQHEKAGSIYSKIAKTPLNDPVILYHMGVVYQKLGKKPEAARAFENALNITDEFAQSLDAETRLRQLGAI